MSAQSPGSYGVSVLLHGAVVGLVIFFTYANFHNEDDSPKVLELVAGAGDNYGATEAPALGNSSSPVQAPPPLPPDPTPPAPVTQAAPPEASPIQPAPEPAGKPVPKPKVKPTPNPADILKNLENAEARKKMRLELQYQKQKAAEERRAAAEKRLAAANAAKLKHIDAEGIKDGVEGGSTANKTGGAGGKALTREEGNLMDAYFAELLTEIKAAHVQPADVADNLSAKVQIFVAADGSVSSPHIVSSSGNSDFDQSVTEACLHTHSIGPRPDGHSETVVFTFKQHEDDAK